ncbi:MAG: hypothetical protein RLZZ324_16 [Candidatus Parcubacteria bacterium]|jgi:RNA polymerase sigma-70 factor (ECF subfamily)
MTPQEELAAVTAAQAGDAESFGRLYDAYARRIHDYLYYRTHHRETAEDLASRAFLKALEKLGSFDAGKGSFGAWLYRIAHNTLVDHYRADRPNADIEDVWDALHDHKTDLPRDTDARARLTKVEQHLAALPKAQREVVVLRVWDGLSYAEIAAITGKTEAASKMAFSRATAILKAAMPLALLLIIAARPHS